MAKGFPKEGTSPWLTLGPAPGKHAASSRVTPATDPLVLNQRGVCH